MNIKQQLREIYLQKWSGFREIIKGEADLKKIPHPHLLSVSDVFEKKWKGSELRIMIFGISTNGWGTKDSIYETDDKKAIDLLMRQYENWYFAGGNWEYGEPFWNYFYALRELLKYRVNENTSVIWNNVFKTKESLCNLEETNFNLAKEEINILKPNIIIVFGVNAGRVLHKRLSLVDYDNCSKRIDFTEKESEKKRLLYDCIDGIEYPELAGFLKKLIVTYHPNAHRNAGIKLKLMIEALCTELKTQPNNLNN